MTGAWKPLASLCQPMWHHSFSVRKHNNRKQSSHFCEVHAWILYNQVTCCFLFLSCWSFLNNSPGWFRTGVGRFPSCLHKWGMTSSAACECGAEEQTVDHVVLRCPTHRSSHVVHGLTVLDDKKSNGCIPLAPRSRGAQQWIPITRSNDEEVRSGKSSWKSLEYVKRWLTI